VAQPLDALGVTQQPLLLRQVHWLRQASQLHVPAQLRAVRSTSSARRLTLLLRRRRRLLLGLLLLAAVLLIPAVRVTRLVGSNSSTRQPCRVQWGSSSGSDVHLDSCSRATAGLLLHLRLLMLLLHLLPHLLLRLLRLASGAAVRRPLTTALSRQRCCLRAIRR
jgi:hypothetical protein